MVAVAAVRIPVATMKSRYSEAGSDPRVSISIQKNSADNKTVIPVNREPMSLIIKMELDFGFSM